MDAKNWKIKNIYSALSKISFIPYAHIHSAEDVRGRLAAPLLFVVINTKNSFLFQIYAFQT
jgi:hypothetical protein